MWPGGGINGGKEQILMETPRGSHHGSVLKVAIVVADGGVFLPALNINTVAEGHRWWLGLGLD
jgi:hypothetical protein